MLGKNLALEIYIIEIACFFCMLMLIQKKKKKNWAIIFSVEMTKNGCGKSEDSKIECISRMNSWTKLSFWMVVQIQKS